MCEVPIFQDRHFAGIDNSRFSRGIVDFFEVSNHVKSRPQLYSKENFTNYLRSVPFETYLHFKFELSKALELRFRDYLTRNENCRLGSRCNTYLSNSSPMTEKEYKNNYTPTFLITKKNKKYFVSNKTCNILQDKCK